MPPRAGHTVFPSCGVSSRTVFFMSNKMNVSMELMYAVYNVGVEFAMAVAVGMTALICIVVILGQFLVVRLFFLCQQKVKNLLVLPLEKE